MLTIDQAITDFLNHCRYEKNLSPKTVKFYTIDLLQFSAFLKTHEYAGVIMEIDKHPLKAYLKELSSWKPKTVKRKMATIKAMFNYLEFEDLITVNPLRKIKIKIKEPLVLPKAMTIMETNQLFSLAYRHIADAPQGKFGRMEKVRNAAIIELLFATGARVSEVANILVSDIDLAVGVLTIKGKGGKERLIHICDPDTLSALNHYVVLFSEKITRNGGYLWVNRLNKKLSDQSIRSVVRSLTLDAKLTKRVTPHVFRHTFATLLLENDVDIKYIQSMLGHSSIMTTQIYTQVNKEKQRLILQEKHPRKKFLLELS